MCDAFLERLVFHYRFTAFALLPGFDAYLCLFVAMTEPIGLVAGFDDVAVMRQTVQQCRCHLGIAKDMGPFPEGQVRRDDHTGVLVEFG